MQGARKCVCGLLNELGFSIEMVETERHPVIYAERFGQPDWPHVVLYAHYDVQPADPFDLWTSPTFEPEVRMVVSMVVGAADNKGRRLFICLLWLEY